MANTSTYEKPSKVKAIVFLPPEEKEQAKQLAQQENISLSYYIARLIKQDLNNK